jgi:pimeloyl-ACP methyl ester carboxylesterase
MKYLFLIILLAGSSAMSQKAIPLWQTLPHVPAMPPPDATGFAHVNGIRLYYAIFNPDGGRPVILLHGSLGSSDDWGFETPMLDKNHKVIVVDSRGRGRSTMSAAPLTLEVESSDVVALMDFLKIPRASIIGWSEGGDIGLYLAIHHPDRIEKLVAFGANYSVSTYPQMPLSPSMKTMGVRYMTKAKATYVRLSPTPGKFAELLKALDQDSTEPELKPADLAKIKAPTVIADGQYEQFITRKETETLAHLIPGAKLVIMPNVSHGGPLQDPVRFHKIVIKLLDSKQALSTRF